MTIKTEQALRNFNFWSGAKERADMLSLTELDEIEEVLIDLYPDGMDETELNDLFWFAFDEIADWIGTTEEDLLERYETWNTPIPEFGEVK